MIITISRQFGSNGQEIGRQLAEYLDIGYYNKEIMLYIAQQIGVRPEFFEEDNMNEAGFYNVGRNNWLSNMTELSVNAQVFEMAKEMIQGIAQTESAVIVGRCADFILKDNPNCIKVYCYSDLKDRIHIAKTEYKVPKRKVQRFVEQQDKKRAGFYEFYTNQRWGTRYNYDLMLNTSMLSTQEAVEILASLFDQKIEVTSIKKTYKDQYLSHKIQDLSQSR